MEGCYCEQEGLCVLPSVGAQIGPVPGNNHALTATILSNSEGSNARKKKKLNKWLFGGHREALFRERMNSAAKEPKSITKAITGS